MAPATLVFFALVAAANCEWVQLPKLELPSIDLNPSSSASKDQSGFANATIDPLYLSGLQSMHQQLRNSIWAEKKEPTTMQEKVTYLQLLKNRILRHIATKLTELNVSEKRSSRKRFSREAAGGGSDIGFPSLEVALLTLSFLVFAVFLVNMVLVLFSNIFGSNTSTSTGSTGTALGRRRRSVHQLEEDEKNQQTARILQALEDFPKRHGNALNHHCNSEEIAGCATSETPIPYIAQFLLNLKV